MARHDFMLDVTLTQERRDFSGVFAGDPVKAHAAGVEFFESYVSSPARWTGRCGDYVGSGLSAGLDVLSVP